MRRLTIGSAIFLMSAAFAMAQFDPEPAQGPEPPMPPGPPPPGARAPMAPRAPQAAGVPGQPPQAPHVPQAPQPPQPFREHRPPMEAALRVPVPGRWWHDPVMVNKMALTSDQQKKMDEIFQQQRLKLIDLTAALQKEETIMEPLVNAEQPDESKVLAQIDRVAQARAELEKANARMLLGIRRTLTQDQWKKLQSEQPKGPRPGPPQPRGER